MPYASNALFTSAARREGVNVSFATQLRIPMSRAAISRSLSSPSTSAMTGSFRATAPDAYQRVSARPGSANRVRQYPPPSRRRIRLSVGQEPVTGSVCIQDSGYPTNGASEPPDELLRLLVILDQKNSHQSPLYSVTVLVFFPPFHPAFHGNPQCHQTK